MRKLGGLLCAGIAGVLAAHGSALTSTTVPSAMGWMGPDKALWRKP
jgi:hypothetical protein